MTASEFAFLTLGLMLGAAAGAALIVVLRARPPAPREIRVTVAPPASAGRAATFAGDPSAPLLAGPAPRGPGDRRAADRPDRTIPIDDLDVGPPMLLPSLVPVGATPGGPSILPSMPALGRTTVRFQPVAQSRSLEELLSRRSPSAGGAGGDATAPAPTAAPARTGATAVAEVDAPANALAQQRTDVAADPAPPPVRIAESDTPPVRIVAASEPSRSPDSAPAGSDGPGGAHDSGPCADLRTMAEDRCAVAARARTTAEAAAVALRDAQRAYDDETRRADEADAIADPRAVRSAKEVAQRQFRAAREGARSRDEMESAAHEWLSTINRINRETREATARSAKARASANALVTTIERLMAEADGARIAKEAAEEACVSARQAVAECEEAATLAAAAAVAAAAAPAPLPALEAAARFPDDEPELTLAHGGDREARIVRLLEGDRDALLRTVADLAGEDPTERRHWQIAITGLVDAITAQAIEASMIDVPETPAFWSPFTAAQRREIVAALASLGYRYDGLGGFADDRVPSQRDLSLALGYAGLDPMRIRHWPTESEAKELLSDARVAAYEYLAAAAGGFTLSELVDLLGRRADALTDVWNDWGRVRGRLLAAD